MTAALPFLLTILRPVPSRDTGPTDCTLGDADCCFDWPICTTVILISSSSFFCLSLISRSVHVRLRLSLCQTDCVCRQRSTLEETGIQETDKPFCLSLCLPNQLPNRCPVRQSALQLQLHTDQHLFTAIVSCQMGKTVASPAALIVVLSNFVKRQ